MKVILNNIEINVRLLEAIEDETGRDFEHYSLHINEEGRYKFVAADTKEELG